MSSESELNVDIRQALRDTLLELLSVNASRRDLAEIKIKAFEVIEDYGIQLTELALNSEEDLTIRQLASLLLKQYVDVHWSSDSTKFRSPEASNEAKRAIRRLLPLGLQESISKVRASIAYTIATIGHWDWPEEWPELFDILMNSLKDGNEFSVAGAVRVLKEFSRDLTDIQIPQVAPVLLPDIYRIFMEREVYSLRTRTTAIEIFTTFASSICMIGENIPSLSKSILYPILPIFMEAFVSALSLPENSHYSDDGLLTGVLKALTVLVYQVPKVITSWMNSILPLVWSKLTFNASKYDLESQDSSVDSDGDVLCSDNLIFAIFEFVYALIETPNYVGAVKSGLSDLLYYIILYMQISNDKMSQWEEHPDCYIDDEDGQTLAYTVRISSLDLLSSLMSQFEEEAVLALIQSLERHLNESQECKRKGSAGSWWKIHEAVFLSLGSSQENLETQMTVQRVKFDISFLLQNVVLPDIANPVSPFLLGRCLWLGSKFVEHLSSEAFKVFWETTVRSLQEDQMLVIRIMALRSLSGYISFLKVHSNKDNYLIPYLPSTYESILNLCSKFNHSSELMGLILENLPIIILSDEKSASVYEPKITSTVLDLLIKYNSDPLITNLTNDIFKALCQNPLLSSSLNDKIIPHLVSLLQSNSESGRGKYSFQSVAFEVLTTLLRASKAPLSELVMSTAFPAAIHFTLKSDDHAVMQNGGECLRAFISVSPDQSFSFVDSHQKTGLFYLVQVVCHLLNPTSSEFTASFVGNLVNALILQAGDKLGADLHHVLKAVLSKLQSVQTLNVIQSLLMVYAKLMIGSLEPLLHFLSSVPGPHGENALHFVLSLWVSRQISFFGAYERKVMIVALSKLLQFGVNTNDVRLRDIIVAGDEILSSSLQSSIITRSQRKEGHSESWTQIHLLPKIFKLLVYEMSSSFNDDGVSEDEEEEGEMDEGIEKTFVDLSSRCDLENDDEDEDEDEDPDVIHDPIYKLNLKVYLTDFLKEFSAQPYFDLFLAHTNSMEKTTLKKYNIIIS